MNDFVHSCHAAPSYPKNLISPGEYQHSLQNYVSQLDEHNTQLFDVEDKAALAFWELNDGLASTHSRFNLEPAPATNQAGRVRTDNHQGRGPGETHPLSTISPPHRSDLSICVSVESFLGVAIMLSHGRFVHAPNSRAKLRLTRKMFSTVASYHQIMPSFLDFVFSFGTQHHAKDFHFVGFRHDTRLTGPERRIAIPALGRSGRILQLCYSLRSVERSPIQENWPWSIRGAATHHSFDFETGRASWMIVKGEGGASMRDRIMTETTSDHGQMPFKFGSRDQAFASSMSTHLLFCNWSAESWRWYINYMEEQVQAITRKTLSVRVAKAPQEATPQFHFTRAHTGVLIPLNKTPTSKTLTAPGQKQMAPPTITAGGPPMPGPPGPKGSGANSGPPPRLSKSLQDASYDPSRADSEFSFDDLRRIEYIEEHVNGALLVITLNCSILHALVEHYTAVMESVSCPHDLKTKCASQFRRFVSRILHICAEMQMQKARLETLLRLLTDRKALVRIRSRKPK